MNSQVDTEMAVTAWIAVGANVGERAATCEYAIALLDAHPEMAVVTRSALHEYPALTLDDAPQPAYLNGVVAVATTLTPQALLAQCLEIERQLGRTRPAQRWAPRVIDLDLLAYGDLAGRWPGLTLPHPGLHLRRFVLEPLAAIAPGWRHPVSGLTVREMLEQLQPRDRTAQLAMT